MKQFYPLVALAVMLAGGWFFFTNVELNLQNNSAMFQPRTDASLPSIFPPSSNLEQPNLSGTPAPTTSLPPINATPLPSTVTPPPITQQQPPASNNWSLANAASSIFGGNTNNTATRDKIRIASFNIQVFGEDKLSRPDIVNVLTKIVRNFDIVAIQEIRSKTQDVLPLFTQQLNSTGRRYDFVIGERLGRTASKEQYAYVFDTDTIEIDRRSIYTVYDPDDLLHREPLVGWFRCKGVDPRQAFTFSLVNVHVDPDEVTAEINVLDDVFRAVRDDGRGEDDVILLGDLNANDQHLGHLARLSNITWVIRNTPTNTRRNAQFDNILFDSMATAEFQGRGGVFDFMHENNLTEADALKVSDHLPVWAEFSVYEGGVPGRVANRSAAYAPAPSPYDRRYAANYAPYGSSNYSQGHPAYATSNYAYQNPNNNSYNGQNRGNSGYSASYGYPNPNSQYAQSNYSANYPAYSQQQTYGSPVQPAGAYNNYGGNPAYEQAQRPTYAPPNYNYQNYSLPQNSGQRYQQSGW